MTGVVINPEIILSSMKLTDTKKAKLEALRLVLEKQNFARFKKKIIEQLNLFKSKGGTSQLWVQY